MTTTPELPPSEGLSTLQDLEALADADPRDLGNAQLSVLRRMFETVDEGVGLFLFARSVFGYRDLTVNIHLPICRLLSLWGTTIFEDGFTSTAPPNELHETEHGEIAESYRRLMVTIPREHFKCLSPEDLVQTPRGYVPAGCLIVGDIVISHDGERQVISNRPGRAPLYTVRTKSGCQLRCTANHPLFTVNGWRQLSELQVGSAVAAPRTTPTGLERHNRHRAYWAGALTGDGHLGLNNRGHRKTPTLECHDTEILDAINAEGVKYRRRANGTTYSFYADDWHRLPDEMWAGAWDKKIPHQYEASAQFLSGLFDTDGTCNKQVGVVLTTVSERLARDVKRNLSYHGVFGRLWYGHNHWRVVIRDAVSLSNFEQEIGFQVNRKQKALRSLVEFTGENRRSSSHVDGVPPEWKARLQEGEPGRLYHAGIRVDNNYWTSKDKLREVAECLNRQDLSDLAADDLVWDEVVSVEPLGVQPIAQLSINGDHTFIAEGLLNHNTSLCTRANPVWQIARDPNHDLTFGIFNEKAENAQAWCYSITQVLERSRLFQLLWPEMLPRGISLKDQEKGTSRRRDIKWGAGGILFERNTVVPELSIEPHGIGGAVTGKHYTHKILDDIIGKEAAFSEAVMQSAKDWVDTARPLERPAEHGCELVAHTPWGYNDVYVHMLKKWPDEYRVYKRHLLEDPEGNPDPYEGLSIFPEKISTRKAKQMFKTDPFHFSSQYLCVPRVGRDQSFDPEWIGRGRVLDNARDPVFQINPEHFDPTRYDPEAGDPENRDNHAPACVPLSWINKAVLLDPAPTKPSDIKSEPRATNGFAVVGKDPWGRRYLFESKAERITPNEVLGMLFDLSQKWHTDLLGIEAVNFSAIYAPLFEELGRFRYPDWRPQFFPLDTKGREKRSRIRQLLIAPMENRMWYFNSQGTGRCLREILEFPNGETLDVIDALSYTDEALTRPQTPTELERSYRRQLTQDHDRGLTGYGVFMQRESRPHV